MPNTDREVFAYFRADPKAEGVVSSLAYALVAFDKFEWMAKVESLTRSTPSQAEVDLWIAQLPDSRLNETRQAAANLLQKSYDSFVDDTWAEAYEAGKNDAVILQVQAATSFWRNFPGNLFVGVVSSFAFALLLIAAASIFAKDPSPIALYNKLATPAAPPPK